MLGAAATYPLAVPHTHLCGYKSKTTSVRKCRTIGIARMNGTRTHVMTMIAFANAPRSFTNFNRYAVKNLHPVLETVVLNFSSDAKIRKRCRLTLLEKNASKYMQIQSDNCCSKCIMRLQRCVMNRSCGNSCNSADRTEYAQQNAGRSLKVKAIKAI